MDTRARFVKALCRLLPAALSGLTVLVMPLAARGDECKNGTYSSTFELIQKAIFERRGCTDNLCHGSAASGGLDLRGGAAYQNLIDADAQSVPGYKRVIPGLKHLSLLWLNLAAATLPDEWKAPLRPMPLSGPPLTANELEVMRLWIEDAAPVDGVVPGTAALLDACLPPPGSVVITPLPPPAPGTGVQLHMPRWELPPHSEREVCFASYYDVSDQVPAAFRAGGGFLVFNRHLIRQEPFSHHQFGNLYFGREPISAAAWGEFKCRGGAREGNPCDPLDREFCGLDSGCATAAVPAVGCIGYGPPDYGVAHIPFSGSQAASQAFIMPEGVFAEIPMKGIVVWNSHAFNLTSDTVKIEAWLNYEFAPPNERVSFIQPVVDSSQIFKMNVPPFTRQEVCNGHVFPGNAVLYELSSHTHKRGKQFRIFQGAFTCQGGPADKQSCSPLGSDPDVRDICAGAPCQSLVRAPAGDCNRDDTVTVDELLRGVNIVLGRAALGTCPDMDTDGSGSVDIADLLVAVNAALNGMPPPVPRDPTASLLYQSTLYSDPVIKRFDPGMVLPGTTAPASQRTLTYCSLYDNGYTNPDQVRRLSTAPIPSPPLPRYGNCPSPTHCFLGRRGAPCVGSTQAARHASCDSAAGAGDGLCDACPLLGGVTTDDEMFIMIAMFYIPGVSVPFVGP